MRLAASAVTLLLARPTPRVTRLRAFGASLPEEIVDIHAAFYEPNERERAKGAPPKPTLGELKPLYSTLRKVYGSDALAVQAAQQNPQIINPLYTRPAVATASKAALVTALGSEQAAIEVMLQNPAVLQCGESLADQPADEIRRFAAIRSFADSVPPAVSLAALALFLLAGIAAIALKDAADETTQQALAALRPVIGLAGASIFLATVAGLAGAQRDLKNAERRSKGRAKDGD